MIFKDVTVASLALPWAGPRLTRRSARYPKEIRSPADASSRGTAAAPLTLPSPPGGEGKVSGGLTLL